MPTYHTEFEKNLPALPQGIQAYVQALESLATITDKFLRRHAGIGELRQSLRQVETAGKQAGRLKARQVRETHPDQQPGANLQPPREER